MRGLAEIQKTNENPHGFHGEEQFGVFHPEEEALKTGGPRVDHKPNLETLLADLGLAPRRDSRDSDQKIRRQLDDIFFAALLLDIASAGNRYAAPMETIGAAIDAQPPFLRFWQKLNDALAAAGKPEADYRTAKTAFSGGKTPLGAITFVGKDWNGVRSVPSEPITSLGGKRPAYHGEYREVTEEGTVWHKVTNRHDLPIAYALPEAALIAAKDRRDETVSPDHR